MRTTPAPVKVTRQGNRLIVTPAPALRRTISRSFPGYALSPITAFDPELQRLFLARQPPPGEPAISFVCIGDFDGNGLPDVALFLKNRRNRWLLAAFHQTGRGDFQPHRLARAELPPDGLFACWITCRPPGSVQPYWVEQSGDAAAAARSKHDWIEEEDDGATENYGYYFRGGRYRSVRLG